MRQMLIDNGFQKKQVVVNHLFPYDEAPEDLLVPVQRKRPLVLYVGRIFIEKGVYELVEAFSQLSLDCDLVICGTGWDEKRCQDLVRKLGLCEKVKFNNFIPKEDLWKLYASSSIVVVPSVWPEPFALIGIEAFQFKKPVVAFDSGGISEWLKDGVTGFLVERLNIKKMACKIDLLLKDKELAQKMGQAGRALVEREFGLKKHLDKLEATLKQAVL